MNLWDKVTRDELRKIVQEAVRAELDRREKVVAKKPFPPSELGAAIWELHQAGRAGPLPFPVPERLTGVGQWGHVLDASHYLIPEGAELRPGSANSDANGPVIARNGHEYQATRLPAGGCCETCRLTPQLVFRELEPPHRHFCRSCLGAR